MGKDLVDKYSFLHFSVGSVAYYWGLDLVQLLVAHTVFEVAENSDAGVKFINDKLIRWWPGGKRHQDSFTNVVGDTISVALGWAAARQLDKGS